MKLSLITTCFNSERTIESTLASVEKQIIDGFELEYIIIDGNSTDTTLKIVEKYDHIITKLISEFDDGIYDAFNKGIKASTGDVIGFLHSDDLLSTEKSLQNVSRCFKEDSGIDVVYSDLIYVDRDDPNKPIYKRTNYPFSVINFYLGWMPPHPTIYIKKEVYERYGCFNTNLKTSSDYEFLIRTLLHTNVKVFYHPSITINMRIGGFSDQSFAHRIYAFKEDISAWSINGYKTGIITVLLKIVRKIPQYFFYRILKRKYIT